jgi:hypothetical protein
MQLKSPPAGGTKADSSNTAGPHKKIYSLNQETDYVNLKIFFFATNYTNGTNEYD